MKMDAELSEAMKAEPERLELLLMVPAVRGSRERGTVLLTADFLELPRYISRRLNNSSFSRLGQFVHSRQQTRRTATPRVTRMANTLAYEANQ